MKHILLFLMLTAVGFAQGEYARIDSMKSATSLYSDEFAGYNFHFEFFDCGEDTLYLQLKIAKPNAVTGGYDHTWKDVPVCKTRRDSLSCDSSGRMVLEGDYLTFVPEKQRYATFRLRRPTLKPGAANWFKATWYSEPKPF